MSFRVGAEEASNFTAVAFDVLRRPRDQVALQIDPALQRVRLRGEVGLEIASVEYEVSSTSGTNGFYVTRDAGTT